MVSNDFLELTPLVSYHGDFWDLSEGEGFVKRSHYAAKATTPVITMPS